MSSRSGLSVIYGSTGLPARPLSREEALAGQRGRLLAGIASAVAEKGYAEATIADVVKRAATSRRTFYEHFTDKEDCYIAAYRQAVEYILSQMGGAGPAANDWLELLPAVVDRYLSILSVEPEFARAFIVEVGAAGERALDERDAVHARFASMIQAVHAAARQQDARLHRLPEEVFVGLVAAVNELVASRVRGGRLAELTELADTVVLLIASTFLGAGLVPAAPAERAS